MPSLPEKGENLSIIHDELARHTNNDHQVNIEIEKPVTWWKSPGLRRLYLLFPFLLIGSTVNGYDGSLLNGLQTMPQWQRYFNYPSGATLGLFTAIQNVGGFCALFVSAYAADLLGRRGGVTCGLVFLFVGVIIQVVPGVTTGMFVAGRFLVGFGSNVSQGSAPLLIMELAHPRHRGRVTTMYNTLWYVGSIIAAWTVFGTIGYKGDKAWRVPVGLQAMMPLVQICGVWFLPESPRWLCFKDKSDEASKILVKYHADGNMQDTSVRAEFIEIQETLDLEKRNKNMGWDVFIRTPGNRKRLLLIIMTSFFSQCSGNGIASYYLHDILESVGVTSSSDQALVNGGLQIWSFLVAIGFSFLVDKAGRRRLFLTAGLGMLLAFSVWTGCSAVYAQNGSPTAGRAVIAMIFLFYFFAGFAWPGLTVAYVAEILPYKIRAKGLAIGFAFTAGSSVLNQYVNPIGLANAHWKFYFVYIIILVIECFCIFFLFVETKGPTLEEIARLFDGRNAAVADEVTIANRLSEKVKSERNETI